MKMWFWIRVGLFSLFLCQVTANLPHRKYEYKYSFKPPYLAQRDGSVPFWTYGGNAIASADNLRLAPSLKSQKGAVWTKNPTSFDWWDVELVFRVTGRGRIGADGMAFWYTAQPGHYDGTVFGSSDQWVGLGIFFDSFDNDNKHNNPYIMAVVNDGSKVFDHANDGAHQMLTGCLRDFRNKPFPTKAKIEYYKNTLMVLFHNGNSQNDDYEMCLRVENVFLPKNGYFGVSAATGGLADDHDVVQFLTHSLSPPESMAGQPAQTPRPEDQMKLTEEYAEYQRKLELQKEQYKKEHPEAVRDSSEEFDEWYETDSQRELRQVFSMQTQMYDAIRVLSQKLDEVIGRQERTLSLISTIPGQIGAGAGSHQMPDPSKHQLPSVTGLDSLTATQKELYSAIVEVRNFVVEVNRKTDVILNNQVKQPTAQVQSVGFDNSVVLRELQEGISALRRDASFTAQKLGSLPQSSSCPNINCLSTTMFISFFALQFIILVGYFVYRNRKENQAKKFY